MTKEKPEVKIDSESFVNVLKMAKQEGRVENEVKLKEVIEYNKAQANKIVRLEEEIEELKAKRSYWEMKYKKLLEKK